MKLAMHNPLGRLVRQLVSARQPAGLHQVRWDGRNDAGLPAASGVYFSRLSSGHQVRNRRMLLMK